MRKLLILLLLLSLVAMAADKKARIAPLLALREARQGHENMIWMDQRVKIGGESVTGSIEGTGGADDAIMAFQFQEDWDMLTTTVGFKDTSPKGRKAEFRIESGGKVLYSSGVLESKGVSHKIRVPIRGYRSFLLRITADRYNDTAGAAWGEPTVHFGLTDEEMKSDWNLSINNQKSPLEGSSAPPQVYIPLPVPTGEEVQYRLKIRKDAEGRTVIVDYERENN